MVGYAEPHSLGGQLRSGKKEVKIFGELHSVRAEVKIIDSFSAHGDYNEMLKYLTCQDPSKIKKVFLVHGDYEAQKSWKERLSKQGFRNIEIPESSDHFIFE
jgi:metallo-beta-lactamase family protein